MARAVVLYFENNEEADAYIKDYGQDYTEAGGSVELVVAVPTLFCQGGCGRGRVRPWTRGLKWGWWVCVTCKKPCQATFMETLRACLSQAVQLLPDGDPAEEDVMQEGWGVLGRD